MARVLGIIGGGQLGMMIAEAAARMPEQVSRVIVLDPTEGCPASLAGADQMVAGFGDVDAITRLSREADVITYEIESGDSAVLKSVEGNAEISPSPETLRIIQDKLLQKEFLRGRGLPVADFEPVGGMADLEGALGRFGCPALLKARRDGYDGRGNYLVGDPGEAGAAFAHFAGRALMLERLVPFRLEVSVIAARSTCGEIRAYPPVENAHEEGVLRQTIAPARIPDAVARRAAGVAEEVMSVLEGAGVFGIEMFVTRDDRILVNEIAPRVHNSGHHTLHSSETSQFEQHLRAILGMDLGGTRLLHRAVMHNILGPAGFEGPYAPPEVPGRGMFLKMYGKSESRPLRKLGHLNVVGLDGEGTGELLARLGGLGESASVRPI